MEAQETLNLISKQGLSVFDSHIEMKNKNFIAGKIKKNEAGELYLDMVSDGVYCGMGTIDKLNVTKGSCGDLDTTVPNDIVITRNKVTSNSITIAVSVITGHSGVKYYEYSMDGGSTYTSSTNDSHIFTGLKKDTDYQIKVRVTAGNNLTGESETKIIHTSDVDIPTYVVESADHWSTSKKVTITYPEVEGYTYEYSLDKGSTWNIAESTNIEIPFSSNGTLVARVTDGVNVVLGESISITKITGTEISDYVQDGLQVFYDGKNATGVGPNSNTSSTKGVWKDLSGNGRDGTLIDFDFNGESGWVEKGLLFGEKADYVRIGELNYDAVTLESVINFHSLFRPEMHILSNVEVGGYNLEYKDDRLRFFTYRVGTGYTRTDSDPVSFHQLSYIAGRTGPNVEIVNHNLTKFQTDRNGAIGNPERNTYFVLGGNPYQDYITDNYLHATMYVARVYNRVLTDDEIEKNYVIDMARYEL